jgi:hypothetical protein
MGQALCNRSAIDLQSPPDPRATNRPRGAGGDALDRGSVDMAPVKADHVEGCSETVRVGSNIWLMQRHRGVLSVSET